MWSFQFRWVWFDSGFSLARALGINKLPFPPEKFAAGLAPPGAAAAPGAVGLVSVVVAGSGGPGPGLALSPA